MTKGILIIGDRNNVLTDKILSYYKNKRSIQELNEETVDKLHPEIKTNDVHVLRTELKDKTKQKTFENFFSTELHGILINSTLYPSITTKKTKHIYSDYYVSIPSLKSGIMQLRLKFILNEYYENFKALVEKLQDQLNSDKLFVHIKVKDITTFNVVEISNFDYRDDDSQIEQIKFSDSDFDIENQFTNENSVLVL